MTPLERIEMHRAGTHPRTVARLSCGWVELAENGFRRGYCLLLADPLVPSLTALAREDALAFLADVDLLCRAVVVVSGAVRANVSIYGNQDPFLHAHVVPRFDDEPEEERALPPLSMPLSLRTAPETAFDPESDRPLIEALRQALQP